MNRFAMVMVPGTILVSACIAAEPVRSPALLPLLPLCSRCVAAGGPSNRALVTPRHLQERQLRVVSGWTVHIADGLLSQTQLTERALALLERQLNQIVRVVPTTAVAELQKVPLFFSPEYPDHKPTAEFHPDAGWLRAHSRDTRMAKAIEFSNLRIFERENDRMPNFVLHELAHAYHFRVLPQGFDNPEIKSLYERTRHSGKYNNVERWHGNGKPNTFERAYAMTSSAEYFAESTEAYFGRNDFFPFTREELKRHDPEMFALLEKLWNPSVIK